MLIHSRLVAYDAKGEVTGELAESFGREADGAWVFRLVPNAVFHNGERVTSADVKHTIEQIAGEKSTAYMRSQFQEVARVETPDDRTVRIHTKTPVATLPTWFGNYNMPIVWRGSPANEPVGCGASGWRRRSAAPRSNSWPSTAISARACRRSSGCASSSMPTRTCASPR